MNTMELTSRPDGLQQISENSTEQSAQIKIRSPAVALVVEKIKTCRRVIDEHKSEATRLKAKVEAIDSSYLQIIQSLLEGKGKFATLTGLYLFTILTWPSSDTALKVIMVAGDVLLTGAAAGQYLFDKYIANRKKLRAELFAKYQEDETKARQFDTLVTTLESYDALVSTQDRDKMFGKVNALEEYYKKQPDKDFHLASIVGRLKGFLNEKDFEPGRLQSFLENEAIPMLADKAKDLTGEPQSYILEV